jgi:xylulokinase
MYLGLDLGTSELKALLLDRTHRVVGVARAALTVQRPHPLWSEQHPHDWWQATESVMQQLRERHGAAWRELRGIGLSGQMHGAVLLDERGQVLRPAILWNDGRSGAQCEALTRAVPHLSTVTGNLAMPGFTAPKLLWVREHEPHVFAKTARVLLPKDWLRLVLSGEAVSEMSDASGTLWLDVGARRWSREMLAACGLNESHMPRLVEGSDVSARLKPELCARWGLPAGLLIAGGGGDNAASAVGMGMVAPGQGFVSLGTSGVIFVSTDRFLPNPAQAMHAFCHALPRRWHQMSVMLSAAGAVGWATRMLGFEDEAALTNAAAGLDEQAREQAPIFLPYLSGERTPHNDPHAQGVLFGLTQAQDRAALAYAVVEGVSFGLLDGSHTLHVPADAPVRELSVVGGGARSAWWVQLLADGLRLPLTTHEAGETGGALGAARLAWLADGGELAQVCAVPPVARRFEPRAAAGALLADRHARFRALYGTVKAQFARH